MYKIKNVVISHNKRMLSGLIRKIEYSPNSAYQIIIGPNGVGKSAMMDQLSPMPSAKANFNKDGGNTIVFETDDGEIEISSKITGTARHEFIKDGINLNTGGTSSVQKDLVMRHFKITDLAYEIINRKFSFVRAAPGKRQEIMTQLANNDMTYAYGLFTEAKRKLSHAVGAKKMLEENIAEKKTLLIGDDEIEAMEKRLSQYHNDVMDLLRAQAGMRHPSQYSTGNGWDKINQQIDSLATLFPTSNINASDRTEFVSMISAVETSLSSLKMQQGMLQNEYDDLDDLIKRASDSSVENIERLKHERDYHVKILNDLNEHVFFNRNVFSGVTSFVQAEREINSVWSEWKALYGEITSDTDGVFTRDNYLQKQATLEKYKGHLNNLNFKLSRIEEQLEHLNDGKKVNCPQCGFHFTPGVSIDARPRLEKERNDLFVSIRKGQEAIEALTEELSVIDKWINDYRSILNLERVCPNSGFFFSGISTLVDTKKQPLQTIVVATQLLQDLEILVRCEVTENKIQEVTGLLKTLEENNVQGIQGIIQRHISLKERIKNINQSILEKETTHQEMTKVLNQADRYDKGVEKVTEDFSSLVNDTHNEIQAHFEEIRNIIVQDLQGHIGNLTKQINDVKTLKEIITDLEAQLEKQVTLISGYKSLVDALSPKHGVVAEQMSEFNRAFVQAMNDVISGIWTYPMEILPGKKEDGVIDYIFPFIVHENDEPIKDISEGSDGQLAIFDFAFLITAMVYLGQVNVPLLLDEVDRPLEPAHKERLMFFLTRAVETGRFSQIFLISHHASSHGALPFSDIIDFNFKNPQDGSNVVATLS